MKSHLIIWALLFLLPGLDYGDPDNPRTPGGLRNSTRIITIDHSYLRLPIRNEGPMRHLTFIVDGKREPTIDIQLADESPNWWASKDVTTWRGKDVTLIVDNLPKQLGALTAIDQTDQIAKPGNLYHEELRPQFHFSSQQGWLNDPNGLVYYQGEYHLFYQHNPYGCGSANKSWGHAVSTDLIHWKELGDALLPDSLGAMYSGSAVVDWNNSSGFGKKGKPPLILIYTAAGNPHVQCLAYSLDGWTFTKYSGNPVVKQISPGNRDPKVIWYEPKQCWVMVLYVGIQTSEVDEKGRSRIKDTIHFLSSPNLKDWTVMSQLPFSPECPDLFELPLDGNIDNSKWVLTSANGDYAVGRFDGTAFTPETPEIKGQPGSISYAAQTYSDIPAADGRRIHIGWLRAPSPGMDFNQALSLPIELKLISTSDGPRLTWNPVRELNALRGKTLHFQSMAIKPGDGNPLAGLKGDALEISLQFNPGTASKIKLQGHGITIAYDALAQQVIVNGIRVKAPLQAGPQSLHLYLDRTTIEVFGDNGTYYIAQPVITNGDANLELSAEGGTFRLETLDIYELDSAWK